MQKRRKTRVVRIGTVSIGGDNPVAIQSMAKTDTTDIDKTVAQIKELEALGCEIVRVAVKDRASASALKEIKSQIAIPLVGDIHFSWELAIAAIESGVDKVRLNPGNIYKKSQLREIISALKDRGLPLRIGLNSGSVRYSGKKMPMPQKLVSSALDYIKLVEGFKFQDIVISLKASNIQDTLEAYRRISRHCQYPLHLGLTATGAAYPGLIRSSIAVGALLLEGIGDTIRVSLTDTPQAEVKAAKYILEAVGARNFGTQIISCPTCGRCKVDLVKIVNDLEGRLSRKPATPPLKVAVMGCVVNGPGEAKEADIGIAFGNKQGLIFEKGKPKFKVAGNKCVGALLKLAKIV